MERKSLQVSVLAAVCTLNQKGLANDAEMIELEKGKVEPLLGIYLQPKPPIQVLNVIYFISL